MEEYIIKERDLKKFSNICGDLDQLIRRIRKYEPSAHLYATPSQMNLMVDMVAALVKVRWKSMEMSRKS